MSYDRDAILNALQETNAVEVKTHAETVARPLPVEGEELRGYLSALEAVLSLLVAETESYAKEHKLRTEIPKDGFEVSYSEFMNAADYREEADALVSRVNALTDKRNACRSALAGTERKIVSAKAYAAVALPFSAYCDTAHTACRLGVLPAGAWESVKSALDENALAAYSVSEENGETVTLSVVWHKSATEQISALLQNAGFTACPFPDGQTGKEFLAALNAEATERKKEIDAIGGEFFQLGAQIKPLKLYCDYIGFELEKAELTEKMRGTDRTFLLEAYVPAGAEETVKAALSSVTGAAYFEFSDPAEGEPVPTFLKNNKVVENFETISNMYSPPSSREFDPNAIMSVFYSVFLGFIMADILYGLIMLVGGGLIWWKNRGRKSGLKSLAGVFAVGGILAIFWGILFNSLAGVAVLPFTVMPDAQKDMWSFVGISIPSVLIIALLIGVVQLLAGYICRMVQCIRWGRVWDGLLDGGVWAVFSLGVALLIVGLVGEFQLSVLATAGAVIAGVSLVFAMLTAGRKEKLLGKFTKGFGALYGVINYVSDILSYARLYGLMLSGAVIAQIVSQYAVQFIRTSVPLAIVGVLLMIVGHAFNLAIGLLGAYIHDARLQYVEFYGRFYEGEGELFTPLGSKHNHVWIAPEQTSVAEGSPAASPKAA